MKVRCTKTAAVAWFFEIPAAVRAKMRPASATPMPPPAGEADARTPAIVAAITNAATESWVPKACNAAPRARMTSSCAAILAPEELDNLDRLRRQRLEVLDDRGELGSQLLFDVLTPTRNGEYGRQDETDDDHDDEQSVEDFGVAPLVQAVAEVKGAPGDREGYQEEDQLDQEARQAQQRAGSDGGGRVESLLLVEPHLRGQHGCVPAGQCRERVR